ncbi:isoprenyl transferase [Liberiplasma polymorphum]|uniref:isoprenyl transferase n=1 Tax=Liberiplasma polymorphum TaxID=3374570 RepID=UPI0037735672
MRLKNKVLSNKVPDHIAIILDGNGRWAKKRGLDRSFGHKQGAVNLEKITLECLSLGVKVLSVYAFSTENWKRPKDEIDYLMNLPKVFENEYKDSFEHYDVRVVFSGRRDRLSKENVALLERVEKDSSKRKGIILNVCLDYGSKDELVNAAKAIAKKVKENKLSVEAINEEVFQNHLYTKGLPEVDLLIRTSGEIRLSNYLLWQVAYAEFYFTKTHWPAFNEKALYKAIRSYQNRNRKFGGLKG